MADINPDDIPFVPDTSVSLIDVSSGKPKTAFHDWMSSIFDWMKRSVVDLTTKITTLTDTTDDLSAAITEEQTARIDGDAALASQITTVEAKANSATASGQVFLAAKASPAGASASYGWYLTAGSAFAGMEALALSGGGSAIAFTANKWFFVDSGTAQTVFQYDGAGLFSFNGNVRINGSVNIINGTITVNGIESGAVGYGGLNATGAVDLPNSDVDTTWYDASVANLAPAKDGRTLFLFDYRGSAGSRYTDGVRTLQFRIVRRKGGDTVVYGPVTFNTVGFNFFRWFFDQPGAGAVQYVCQHAFVSQTGSASGSGYVSRTDFFRIDWQGIDT